MRVIKKATGRLEDRAESRTRNASENEHESRPPYTFECRPFVLLSRIMRSRIAAGGVVCIFLGCSARSGFYIKVMTLKSFT